MEPGTINFCDLALIKKIIKIAAFDVPFQTIPFQSIPFSYCCCCCCCSVPAVLDNHCFGSGENPEIFMKVSHPRLVPTDRVWLTLIEGTDFSQKKKKKKEREKKNISPSYHLSPCHLQSLTKNQNFFVLKSLSSSRLTRWPV